MCGLTGIISKNGSIKSNELIEMTESISHRGPDGEGIFISSDTNIGLGHRRLAILDLDSSADQPFFDETKETILVYNGEIYNHASLRKELLDEGYNFRTSHSDTEVISIGYKAWGIKKLVSKLNGMFAFIIFSEDKKCLHIVRDRFGIKPLYLLRTESSIYISSEIKAFYKIKDFVPKLDVENLSDHLYFRSLPSPHTLIKGVEKIPPGSITSIDTNSLSENRFSFWQSSDNPSLDVSDHRSIDEIFHSSMNLMSQADVPVGVFLSGGIDSGLVAASLKNYVEEITAFTVTYEDQKKYDEFLKASFVAKQINADHVKVEISEKNFLNDLSKMTYYLEEPISAPVCIPVMHLSEAARKKDIPVILAGEGADEVFIGYESWLQILRFNNFINFFPKSFISLIANFVSQILTIFQGRRFSRIIDLLDRLKNDLPIFWGGAWDFTVYDLKRLLKKDITINKIYKKNIRPIRNEFNQLYNIDDVSAWMIYCDAKFRLPELMLPRLDKLCMAYSIEGRVPFLDHRLFDQYISFDKRFRDSNIKIGKDQIREIYGKYFNKKDSVEKKIGFQAPVAEWKSTAFGEYSKKIVMTFVKRTDIFDEEYTLQIMNSESDRLYYGLMSFVVWYNQYIEEVLPEFNLIYEPQ